MKTMKVFQLSLFAAAAVFAAGASAAPNQTVEAEGEAAMTGTDATAKIKATDEAKKNALRNAVEQVAGTMINADTLTANSTLVSDRVYSHAEGYVKHYELVGEPKVDSGVVSVKVKAEVATADLDKDMQAVRALITRLGNRKIVLLIQEQTVSPTDQVISSGVMGTELTDGFKSDGWTIIDPSYAAGEVKLNSGVNSLGSTEAKRIGQLTKSDYILYGSVAYRQQPTDKMFAGASLFMVTGEYQFTVFATDSGSQLANIAGKLTYNAREDKNISPTISYERTAFELTKKRGQEIMGEVRKAVVEYLSNAEQNGNRLAATVLGLSEYAAVQNFKKVLTAQITGVREVRPGNFGNGKAEFDVIFVGTSDEFAEKIGGKKFQGKNINVTGVTGNTVELTLAK